MKCNITLGTIARTIAIVFVIVNQILKAMGKPLIDVDEDTIAYWLEYAVEILIIIVGFWKNNSFSKYAIIADDFLKSLKNGDVDIVESEVGENE